MKDYINRDVYLQKLIDRRGSDEIKVITGPRRSGKSWLLGKIYYDYLIKDGVDPSHIIHVSLDIDNDEIDSSLLESANLRSFIYSKITNSNEQYYVMLDEIQYVKGFERLVNGLNVKDNIDVYVTGSNSRFLSSDIDTIFRGRGDEIRVYPLSFKEFREGQESIPVNELWKTYYTYGGMPALLHMRSNEQKIAYLQRLWRKTYLSDVVDRYKIRNRQALESVVDALCSAIGSLTNPARISNTLQSVQHVKINSETINSYLKYLEDAYIFEGASRYNIKGHKYYDTIKKYYAVDVGLRNAKLNFRQQEPTHIMENVIYNELRMRGYAVDVGVIETRPTVDGKAKYSLLEVDFVASDGNEKFYIQSAFSIPDEEKRKQEKASLLKIGDSFKKIVIVGDDIAEYQDDNGITYMGLYQFLLENKL